MKRASKKHSRKGSRNRKTRKYRSSRKGSRKGSRNHNIDNGDRDKNTKEPSMKQLSIQQLSMKKGLDDEKGEYGIVENSPTGRYSRTSEEIGKGAYKTVFKAVDNNDASEVAWAIINVKGLSKKEKQRILYEIRLLDKILGKDNHTDIIPTNIIKLRGTWSEPEKKRCVMITDLIPGGTLKSYIEKHHNIIKYNHIINWAIQIIKGLIFLHSNAIIHRDLKLDNIFIDPATSIVYLADFGLSIEAENSDESVGTMIYMAPEMFATGTESVLKYDNSIDMYAFGICLLEMLTNEEAYHEIRSITHMIANKNKNILPLSLRKVRDPNLQRIITRLLSIDIEERYTAHELYEILNSM